MSIKFKKIDKTKLRNDAHFQFHTEFKDALGKMTAVTAIGQIAPQWAKAEAVKRKRWKRNARAVRAENFQPQPNHETQKIL